MAITQGLCTSFKKELLEAKHDFRAAGHTFYIALYTSAATLNSSTTDYTATNEVTGTGYTAGGQALTNIDPTTGSGVAFSDFADEVFASVTISGARGALIYNTTTAGGSGTTNAICVLDFGTDKSVTAGDMTIQFPSASASTAIIRIE